MNWNVPLAANSLRNSIAVPLDIQSSASLRQLPKVASLHDKIRPEQNMNGNGDWKLRQAVVFRVKKLNGTAESMESEISKFDPLWASMFEFLSRWHLFLSVWMHFKAENLNFRSLCTRSDRTSIRIPWHHLPTPPRIKALFKQECSSTANELEVIKSAWLFLFVCKDWASAKRRRLQIAHPPTLNN